MAGNATVHPVDDRLLIRRQTTSKTEAGLELPEDSDPERVLTGVIAATGPGMPTMAGNRMPLAVANKDGELVRVALGDGVIYPAASAQEITIVSGKFDLIHFRDVIAVLKAD